MDRLRLSNLAFFIAAAAVSAPLCAAQTTQAPPAQPYPVKPVPSESSTTPYPVKPVPSGPTATPYPVKPVPSEPATMPYPAKPVPLVRNVIPFSDNDASAAMGHFIVYRPQEQMSEADRTLEAKMQPAIRDAAALAGIEFDKEKWTYQQLECQAVPSHLFLLFQGEGGAGDVSLFSAAIPRTGNGHVRVIPVERRGLAPFSPAPVNALAIAKFNRIRAEEPAGKLPDWLSTSMCYAALTEPRAEISLSAGKAPDQNLVLSFPPTLEVAPDGESTVRFVNVAAPNQPMQWALTFDPKGQLVKVEHFPTPAYKSTIVPAVQNKP